MKIKGLFVACAITLLAGCANILQRCDDYHAPYVCAKHPYYCTTSVWDDCVCAPFKLGDSNDPIWTSFATLTWPFWLLDEPCEVVLDTVFLPFDIFATNQRKETNQ